MQRRAGQRDGSPDVSQPAGGAGDRRCLVGACVSWRLARSEDSDSGSMRSVSLVRGLWRVGGMALMVLTGVVLCACANGAQNGAQATTSTSYAVRTFTVPLSKCKSDQSLTQIELDACAGEQTQATEHALSRALATESEYLDFRLVEDAQRHWETYASAECKAEASQYIGGTIYPMIVSSCVGSLAQQRLNEVQATLSSLEKEEGPLHPPKKITVSVSSP